MDGGNCGEMAVWAAPWKRPIAACFGHAMRWTVPTRNRWTSRPWPASLTCHRRTSLASSGPRSAKRRIVTFSAAVSGERVTGQPVQLGVQGGEQLIRGGVVAAFHLLDERGNLGRSPIEFRHERPLHRGGRDRLARPEEPYQGTWYSRCTVCIAAAGGWPRLQADIANFTDKHSSASVADAHMVVESDAHVNTYVSRLHSRQVLSSSW